MTVAQPLQSGLVDRSSKFALKLRGEQAAAHADLAMDAPNGQFEALLAQCDMPGADVIVDAVDQRAVEIEEECDCIGHVRPIARAPPGSSAKGSFFSTGRGQT